METKTDDAKETNAPDPSNVSSSDSVTDTDFKIDTYGIPAARVPLIASVLGIATVAFTLASHVVQSLEPPIPTISMTACRPGTVETFTFTIGLCCSACLLIMTGYIVSWRFPSRSLLARTSFWSGVIASLGLAVTSAVPLQPDIMEVLKLPRKQRVMNTQSLVHQNSANVFFLGALVHAVLYTLHLRSLLAKDKHLSGVNIFSLRTKYVTIVMSCCFILSPLLLMMYPQIIKGSRVTIIAVNQYGAIISLLGFFGTYTLDLSGYRIRLDRLKAD